MSSNRVACPYCGHDGTAQTSRPPLGSYGFNYLAEGAASPAGRSLDEGVRLLGAIRGDGSPGDGARIECRSCWRSFPIPEDPQWAEVPVSFPGPENSAAAATADIPASDALATAADSITRSLLTVFRNMTEEARQDSVSQITRLDADLTALREQASSAAMAQEMWLGRIAAVEAAVRAQQANYQGMLEKMQSHEGVVDELRALCARLQTENQAFQQRLDAQAAVIRSLHSAAIEQTARREELRSAVQRLEELTSSGSQMHPLPEQL